MTSTRWLLLTLTLVVVATLPAPALGQTADGGRQDVEGTADHRPAPLLGPGQYTDTIVTGETIWYAVLYTNNEPYRVEVDLDGVDLDSQDDLTLQASFVGPTLGPIQTDRLLEGSASYGGGGTNLWYVRVTLDTEGRRGVEHTLLLDVAGVESEGFEDCTNATSCALADDLAAAQARLEEARQGGVVGDGGGATDEAAIRTEIEELEEARQAADTDLRAAQQEIAALCAPASTCDTVPPSADPTPLWAWLVAGVLLVIGAGLLVVRIRRARGA